MIPKEAKTTEMRFAIRAHDFLAKRAVAENADRKLAVIPSVEELASDFEVLAQWVEANAQLNLIMKITNSEAMERGRGMYLMQTAKELREVMQTCYERMAAEEQGAT